MEDEKGAFIEFMVRSGVLAFGDFTTKSGRRTPYFVNTGRYSTGEELDQLGSFYAATLRARLGDRFDVLFGPAYKGIPLACATALVLHRDHGRSVATCFNRKEEKDHGEGGTLVGHRLQDGERVVLIEDVTTAGTSIRETVPLLRAAARIELAGLIVSLDRKERGPGSRRGPTALEGLEEEFEMPCFAIVDVHDVIAHLAGREVAGRVVLDEATAARMGAYLEEFGPP